VSKTADQDESLGNAWLPDLIYSGGTFKGGVALIADTSGRIARLAPEEELSGRVSRLQGRAMLPGLVNAHSHAFQRVIRGRTEYRTTNTNDSFWTWREMMYAAAARLTPEDVYDSSRMAFLEMALSGITAVGEFHYLHNSPEGTPYDDPNLLAKQVIRAANDVGLRIALLRVGYARSGYQAEPNPRQARFIEPDAETYLVNLQKLRSDLARGGSETAWAGIAPHSIRAAPLDYLRELTNYGKSQAIPTHMHVAEQPAEVTICLEEYGRTPVELLETEGLLHERFTCVHAIYVTPAEAVSLGKARAMVCACPTTERNLGDGILPADLYFDNDVSVGLGTDSHTQIDLLEDARELEYHLRLSKQIRAVLAHNDGVRSSLAARLFDCATIGGARSIGASTGLDLGMPADFFTIDLNDPSVAGSSPDDLLANVVFSLNRAAVRDVVIGGKTVVADGHHADEGEIVERFKSLQRRLWGTG
jgi:formimidoylglutamate deiminase